MRYSYKYLPCFALISSLMAGCASMAGNGNVFWLTKDVQARLPVESCVRDYSHLEFLTVKYGGKTNHLLMGISCQGGGISLLGITTVGTRLFSITKKGENVAIDTYLPMPEGITPQQILWDILLISLPTKELEESLPNGYRIQTSETKRELKDGLDRTVSQISYEDGDPVLLENIVFNYTISIKRISRP